MSKSLGKQNLTKNGDQGSEDNIKMVQHTFNSSDPHPFFLPHKKMHPKSLLYNLYPRCHVIQVSTQVSLAKLLATTRPCQRQAKICILTKQSHLDFHKSFSSGSDDHQSD